LSAFIIAEAFGLSMLLSPMLFVTCIVCLAVEVASFPAMSVAFIVISIGTLLLGTFTDMGKLPLYVLPVMVFVSGAFIVAFFVSVISYFARSCLALMLKVKVPLTVVAFSAVVGAVILLVMSILLSSSISHTSIRGT
jgi:hypothetical protein